MIFHNFKGVGITFRVDQPGQSCIPTHSSNKRANSNVSISQSEPMNSE
jgi:hypothetical protein